MNQAADADHAANMDHTPDVDHAADVDRAASWMDQLRYRARQQEVVVRDDIKKGIIRKVVG